jgi:hypothetical protein
MAPPQSEDLGRQNSEVSESRQSSRTLDHSSVTGNMARSAGIPQRLRNEGMASSTSSNRSLNRVESWVEISSQPSSSSLSSIGDEIVTTGLRIQHDPNPRRRRRMPPVAPSPFGLEARHTGTSSQEEYEESESEEDHVMTSSNEHISSARLATTQQEYDAGSDSDDDDENATALGRRTEEIFTPQPNAFSHPPSSQSSQRPMAPGSYFPRSSQAPNSYPRASQRAHQSSHNQADHDAALRASLTTLLSIGAAAARGLPKRNSPSQPTPASNEPMALRFVPESELMGTTITSAPNSSRVLSPSTRAGSSPSLPSQDAAVADKSKRKATNAKLTGEKARVAKKKKVQLVEEAMISPTLLTWVVSAGVIVVVSVVGFGAGYVIGREVGRGEALGLNSTTILDGGNCGKEVVKGSTGGLRRFRWGGGVAKSIVA